MAHQALEKLHLLNPALVKLECHFTHAMQLSFVKCMWEWEQRKLGNFSKQPEKMHLQ
jgi:hypothetical protein